MCRANNSLELKTLLEEAYAATYKGSSLKVRRRYRKLICQLTQRIQLEQALSQTIYLAAPSSRSVGS